MEKQTENEKTDIISDSDVRRGTGEGEGGRRREGAANLRRRPLFPKRSELKLPTESYQKVMF